jgi:transcriptional regulatory protein LevR
MTKPTADTPPADKVADFSEKLADKPVLPKRNRNGVIVTAAATGIGSAALLAALLYANRSRKPKKPESE